MLKPLLLASITDNKNCKISNIFNLYFNFINGESSTTPIFKQLNNIFVLYLENSSLTKIVNINAYN